MHPNETLIQKLYSCLDAKDHQGMASCYHHDATFKDIAFDLKGIKEIHAMWHKISETDLRARFQVIHADDTSGSASLEDVYTYGPTGNKVTNLIQSKFRFRDGLIIDHQDQCDIWKWASQALGPVNGRIAWLFPVLIRNSGKEIMKKFIENHKGYK